MDVKHCDECNHFAASKSLAVCLLGHRPRFYSPKGAGDTDYGYKRKCGDFKPPVHAPVHAEAWLYEVRFNGSGQNPATDWQKYGVYETRQQAERGLKHCFGELEGRVVPLVRAAAQGVGRE